MRLIALLGVAAATQITVNFPGNLGSEYTVRTPVDLPACSTNTWNIGGETFDGITSCSSNSTTKISVIPFRCAKYNKKTVGQGIHDCETCYYGWSGEISGQIDPWTSADEASDNNATLQMYFVPQFVTSLSVRSCLMVSDENLSTLCDKIIRAQISPSGSTAKCVKDGKSTPFAQPFVDFDQCKQYARVGGKITCVA